MRSSTPTCARNNLIIIKFTESDDIAFREEDLSLYASEKIKNVTNERRRRELIAGDAVRKALFLPFGIECDAVSVRDGGKPYVRGRDDISFSISHSGSLAVGIISSEGEVGIDIELLRDAPERQLRIINRSFSEKERERVLKYGHNTEFYAVWTRKEAYLKYMGKGIASVLSGIDTESDAIEVCFHYFRLVDSLGRSYICSAALPKECADTQLKIEKI